MYSEAIIDFDIIILALVAAFICHRLWSVLGRRNGEAPPVRPDPFAPRSQLSPGDVSDVTQPSIKVPVVPAFNPDDPVSLEGALSRLRSADPAFNERAFLGGARIAFQTIVSAYAAGDLSRLRPLLADDVYRAFENAVGQRKADGQTLETRVDKVDATIDDARLTGTTARITVAFRSVQVNVLRGADGGIVEGEENRADQVMDTWIFARDTTSTDPNWTLVETRHQA